MINDLFWILNYIRTELLEKFELPELGISYWEFLCLLAIVGMVITVLVNSVQVSAGHSARMKNVADREKVRLQTRDNYNSSRSKAETSGFGGPDLDSYEKLMHSRGQG